MPSVVAERLREKFSRIRPRFGQTFPVVPSRLNHPYPAEGAGVRAPGQAVASPSGRSVAEWSVLRSFSFPDPFPSLPDPGDSLPFFSTEGREGGPSRPRGDPRVYVHCERMHPHNHSSAQRKRG